MAGIFRGNIQSVILYDDNPVVGAPYMMNITQGTIIMVQATSGLV